MDSLDHMGPNDAARAARDRLHAVLTSITDGLAVVDKDWRCTYFSEQGARITGIRPGQVLGACVWDIFPEAVGTAFEKNFHRAVETGEAIHFEEFYPPFDKWLECHCHPSEEGLSVYFRDVSARKRAEAELRASVEQLRLITDSVPAAIAHCGRDLRYKFVNQPYADRFGLRRDQIIGRQIAEIAGAASFESVRGYIERALSGEAVEFEMEIPYRVWGTHFTACAYAPEKSESGEVVGFVAVVMDITDRKRSEMELRQITEEAERNARAATESTERLRLLSEIVSVQLWTARGDGQLDFVNAEAAKYFGTDNIERDILGNAWAQYVHPEDLPGALNIWRSSIRTLEPYDAEFRLRNSSGAYRWYLVRAQVMRNHPDGETKWFGTNTDIHDLKVAQDEAERAVALKDRLLATLRLGEERLRMATDAAELGIWSWDLQEDRVTWENDRPYEFFGIPPSEPPVNAARFKADFLHPEDAAQFESAVTETVLAGKRFFFLGRIRRQSGEIRWLEFTGQPIAGRDGKVVSIQGTSADVTERECSAEALRESEERFRVMANSMTQMAWIARPDGHRFWYNQRWYDYTGTTPDQVEGWGWQKVHDPNVLPRVLEGWKNSIATGEPFEMTFPLRGADGDFRQFLTLAFPLKNSHGQVVQWFGTNTDVEEITRTETALRDTNQRMRLATQATGVGVWEWNVFTNQIRWDEEMFRIYGVAPTKDWLVPYSLWSGLVEPEDLPRQEDILQDTVRRGGQSSRNFRIRRSGDGECRYIQSVETVRENQQHQVEWVVGTNLDITERKKAEEALHAAKSAAETANRSKDRFLAVLSHELRTPLTPVLMTVSALEHDPDLRPDIREELVMIKRNIELETKLIDDLLDLSRITSGKVELKRVPVDLNEAVRQVCDICRPQVLEQNVKLEIELGENICEIYADPARLQQVLWNVVKNAVKFTPARGTIRVSTERLSSERCEVRVMDTGIGIPPEVLPRIFTAFEQGDARITKQFGGLGLGLAISRALVELQGGIIRAESDGAGKGATFIVELPGSVTCRKPAIGGPDTAAEAGAKQIRVLLVEDHADTARTLARLLRAAGFFVLEAANVAGAIAAAERESFDLLVSDLGLPDGNGYEIMRAVRARRKVPGIAMSGYGMDEDIRKSAEAGFTEHLIKPIDVPSLIAAIRRVTENRSESRQSDDRSVNPEMLEEEPGELHGR